MDGCERFDRMVRLLEKIERWEADVILDSAAWPIGHAGFVVTDRNYDRWIELQRERNDLLGR
jgi:hypothetical protein